MSNIEGDRSMAPISRFVQETELQRLLTDERLRNEQHKLNFQTLQVEFSRYQEENKKLKNQVKQITEENSLAKESYEVMIQQYKTELVQKQSKIEELIKNVITPQQIHTLRRNLLEELEKAYRERFSATEEETEQYRETCNKLRYNYSFLKAEFEHAQQEFERITEEKRLKYEAEVMRLAQERNNLQSTLNAQKKNQDVSLLKELQNENAELKHRLKLLQNDNEDLRLQKEQSLSHTESLQRLQTKQLAEHAANLRAIEVEKSSLQMQVDRLQRELKEASSVQNDLNSELKDSQQKLREMHTKLQDSEYRNRIELSNVRMESAKQKGELERERDNLRADLETLRTEAETTQQSLQQHIKMKEVLEKESQQRLQTIQDDEWKTVHKLEIEKLELEARVEELERLHIEQEAVVAKGRAEISHHVKEKQALQWQLDMTKAKQDIVDPADDDFQKNKATYVDLLHENKKLLETKQEMEKTIIELREQYQHSQKQLEDYKNDPLKNQKEIIKNQSLPESVITNQQVAMGQFSQFQKRISSLEHQLTETRAKHCEENHIFKAKLKKYRQISVKLRDRFQLQKAKIEELEMEREILKKNIPREEHLLLQKHLKDLQRKLNEFNQVMLTSDPSAVSLPTLMSDKSAHHQWPPYHQGSSSQTNVTEREIAAVKDRLQLIGKKQQQQLIQLSKDAGRTADDEDSDDKS